MVERVDFPANFQAELGASFQGQAKLARSFGRPRLANGDTVRLVVCGTLSPSSLTLNAREMQGLPRGDGSTEFAVDTPLDVRNQVELGFTIPHGQTALDDDGPDPVASIIEAIYLEISARE